jgi:hypothetical protein
LSEQHPWSYEWQLIGYSEEIPEGFEGVTPARMRADFELSRAVSRDMDIWGFIALGCGGKFDGQGYGSGVHDTHGPECCD